MPRVRRKFRARTGSTLLTTFLPPPGNTKPPHASRHVCNCNCKTTHLIASHSNITWYSASSLCQDEINRVTVHDTGVSLFALKVFRRSVRYYLFLFFLYLVRKDVFCENVHVDHHRSLLFDGQFRHCDGQTHIGRV